ncbi:MAG: rod shape-determining protein MreD [Sodalis sp. (in: enterobacteria)]
MTQYRCCCGGWLIWFSFFIAIVLEIMPWPQQLYLFRPSWLNLLLIYWVMVLPHRINVGTGFIFGLIMDLILGSTLGVRALAFSILIYFMVFKIQMFQKMIFWQQVLIVILLSLTTKVIIFLARSLVTDISFRQGIFLSSMVDGILWPWLFLLMRKIQHQFSMQ